ncbi:MAG: magnesium transporter [Stigonema ocellatum SAG 48.90 = DSM 106950]|nr:magnesium transporter [Stigonema ocellatum SAG 48.90 = DSM 106950]
MHNASTVSCEAVKSDEDPPSPLMTLKQAKTQETKYQSLNKQPTQIAAEITKLPSGWQTAAFHKLPRYEAIAVYQLLDTNLQQRLIEDFKKRDDIDISNELSANERVQLFELLYIPNAHINDVHEVQPQESDESFDGPIAIVKQRWVWLFVLLLASTGTTAVIKSQEHILQHVVVLASFIPMLIAYGGNVSTQTATVVVRALNSQQTQLNELLGRVLYREMAGGTLLGAILGLLVTLEALVLQGNPMVALVVGLSFFVISILASFCGSILPFFFQVLGCDPALISAPLGATLVDVAGILIYLNIARLILHI